MKVEEMKELESVREKLVETKNWLHLCKVLDRYNTLFIKAFSLEEYRKIRLFFMKLSS